MAFYRFRFKPAFYFFLLLASLPILSFSQDSTATNQQNFFRNTSIVTRFYYGFLWAHRSGIENLVTGHTTGFEISFQKQTDGSKWWQEVYGHPQTGFSFIHLNLANEYVGNANAIVAYINFPFVSEPNFLFSLRGASGLGHLSRRFERVENHKNLAAGTHVNAAIQLMAETRFRLSKKLFFNLNYGITHFSNGSFYVPNLGVNNISLNAGITYQLTETVMVKGEAIPPLDKRWYLDLVYGFGVKENVPFIGEQYFAHTFCFSFLKPVSYKSSLGVGGDVFYDLSLAQYADTAAGDPWKEMIRSGAHVSYEMAVNKLTMLFHMGVYVYDKIEVDGSFYHRIGFKYQVGKHLFANLSLKTHFARADYVELGAGWRIKQGK